MEQLEFSWKDESALRRELERLTGHTVALIVTDNTSTMMTVKRDKSGGGFKLRIHRMFLQADPRVIRALGDWVRRPRSGESGAVIDEFIRKHRHLIRRRRPNEILITEGIHHDLREMYDTLNRKHFQGAVTAGITWGRMPPSRRRRSIRFGSYTAEDRLIRIHPLLDQAFVPDYFVRYIVFHEMLHAYLGLGKATNGRRCVHSPEFRRREQRYPDYDRAVEWQSSASNLRRLLR
jgi:predicted metal-dependent hydrolase